MVDITPRYTYYGRITNTEPKVDLVDLMLTEYVRKMIDVEIARFREELRGIPKAIKADLKSDMTGIKSSIKAINKQLDDFKNPKKKGYKKNDLSDLDEKIEMEAVKMNLTKKGIVKNDCM
jgi:hypothetical protein